MRSFFSRLFETRRSKIVGLIVGFVLATSMGAAAAFLIYDLTATGTANGTFATASHTGALTYANDATTPVLLDQGSNVTVGIKLTNNDPGAAHTVQSGLTVVPTVPSVPSCATHLSITNVVGLGSGTVVAAGATVNGSLKVNADGTTPSTCQGAQYVLTFTGTTN
jgi:hypothetical protein